MEAENNALVINQVQSIQSTHVEKDDVKILSALNLNLQVKVHNLESEIDRLKKEVQGYRRKSHIYDSLTKDLASLRKQFDKTAVALLQKCEAYDVLKKEVALLKSKATHSNSPRGMATPIRSNPRKVIPVGQNLLSSLSLCQNPMDMDSQSVSDYYSSDDEIQPTRGRNGRPSMGSCGNISSQITAEESMPSRLKGYAAPSAPLRNRLLVKLHSIKSASTESLESAGRKSLRAEQAPPAKPKPAKAIKPTVPTKKPRTNVNTPSAPPPTKAATGSGKTLPAPSAYRPALGPSNGQRMVKISNMASVKRSTSNCSAKSSSSTKPVFRF